MARPDGRAPEQLRPGDSHDWPPEVIAVRDNDATELVEEARRLERELAVVVVDVEHPALRASLRRRVGLMDREGNAVDVAGQERARRGSDRGSGYQ